MNNLTTLQERIKTWSNQNFPKSNYEEKVLGILEEMGELIEVNMRLNNLVLAGARLSHLTLKEKQGIRYTKDELRRMERDAVGDIVIYLIDYCDKKNINFENAVFDTAKEVLNRNWKENPLEANKISNEESSIKYEITGLNIIVYNLQDLLCIENLGKGIVASKREPEDINHFMKWNGKMWKPFPKAYLTEEELIIYDSYRKRKEEEKEKQDDPIQ